jgi:hypothetical protein
MPIVVSTPNHAAGKAFIQIAETLRKRCGNAAEKSAMNLFAPSQCSGVSADRRIFKDIANAALYRGAATLFWEASK